MSYRYTQSWMDLMYTEWKSHSQAVTHDIVRYFQKPKALETECLIVPGIRGKGRYDYKGITREIWGHERTVVYPDFGGGNTTLYMF